MWNSLNKTSSTVNTLQVFAMIMIILMMKGENGTSHP